MSVGGKGEERLLLGGRWLPVTGTVPFLEADVRTCVDMFMAVRGAHVASATGHPMRVSVVHGSLEEILGSVLPLVIGTPSRYLFIPTAGGRWTAYLENMRTGTERGLSLVRFAAGGVRGVSISELPNTFDRATRLGYWGHRQVTVAVPDPTDEQGFVGHSVGVRVNDSRRWELVDQVTNDAFPNPVDHSRRLVPDRFTHDHLVQVAEFFGLRPFDEDFYAPDRWAVLVEHTEPRDPAWPEFTLEQAQDYGRRDA